MIEQSLKSTRLAYTRRRAEPERVRVTSLYAPRYARGVRRTLFAGVPPEAVSEVLSIARRRTFARGEVVFHQGDAANSLHLVSRGRIAARMFTRPGEAALLDVAGPGDVFGEMALLTPGGVRSAGAAALEACEPAPGAELTGKSSIQAERNTVPKPCVGGSSPPGGIVNLV
jgi:Cyclic nucleotide-binding domain